MRLQSPTVIVLDEYKSRYDATFINRFELSGTGARYVVDAEIRFHMPFAAVGPALIPIVRRRIRRFVLEPMRVQAEREWAQRERPRTQSSLRSGSRSVR
jgi:hypothetical protein